MTRLYVDGPTLMRAVKAATRNLERHVDEVDALNVFPVPDGDTGSNMLATMRAALAEAEALPEEQRDLETVAEALSRGALTGARGNSGVILSQIIRGMTHGADGRVRASGVDFAAGLRKGSEVAYQSVLTPVEGTILTVIRDAAEAAEAAAGRQPHVEAVLADVIEAAASSVQRTPTLLPVLEDAGVVDSGGQGLYRVLEGMLQVEGGAGRASRGRRRTRAPMTPGLGTASVAPVAEAPAASTASPAPVASPPAVTEPVAPAHVPGASTHGYEVQYLLSAPAGGLDVPALRTAIEGVGDSVVVAGDEHLARVHVHGERPDLALAAGMRWGRLENVEILDLDAQVAQHATTHTGATHTGATHTGAAHAGAAALGVSRTTPPPVAPDASGGVALVAVVAADGLARILASLGAHVVRPGRGTRPSVGEIAEGILASGAMAAVVLPNDLDARLAAERAADITPTVAVTVVPTRNAAEGIAAALAYDRAASLQENAARMRAEAESVRSFRVITAAKDSVVDSTPVRRGQILAIDAGRHLLASGADVEDVTLRALSSMGEFELITLYCGRSETPGASLHLCEHIELAGFGAEIEVVDGGQAHDHLLVAVE